MPKDIVIPLEPGLSLRLKKFSLVGLEPDKGFHA